MTTVTRLKISVDNDRLPVLTSEGPKNYYLGRYLNAVESVGGSLTQTEKNAAEHLLENAFAHNWIDMVDYFFPFIGGNDKPAAGFLPLIDKGCGYSLDNFGDNVIPFEDAGNSFGYVNDRIVKYGVSKTGAGFTINGSIKYNNNKVSFVLGIDPSVPLSTTDDFVRFLFSKGNGDHPHPFGFRTGRTSASQDIEDLYVSRFVNGIDSYNVRVPRPLLSAVSNEYFCHFCAYSNQDYCRGTFDKTNTAYNIVYENSSSLDLDNIEFNYTIGNSGASSLSGLFYAAFLNKIPTVTDMKIMHTDFLQFMTELHRLYL